MRARLVLPSSCLSTSGQDRPPDPQNKTDRRSAEAGGPFYWRDQTDPAHPPPQQAALTPACPALPAAPLCPPESSRSCHLKCGLLACWALAQKPPPIASSVATVKFQPQQGGSQEALNTPSHFGLGLSLYLKMPFLPHPPWQTLTFLSNQFKGCPFYEACPSGPGCTNDSLLHPQHWPCHCG